MTFNPNRRKKCPSTKELKEQFDYKEGFLICKKTNKAVGVLRADGYYQVSYQNVQYLIHRLIWVWHGNDLNKDLVIDHKDNDPSNNRIENLRQITQSENTKNCKRYKSCKYVYYDRSNNVWKARSPRIEGKRKFIGNFKSKEEALKAVEKFVN